MVRVDLRNSKWTPDQFENYLEEVRRWYPTGKDVDLDEAVEYHKKIPERRNEAKLQAKAQAEGRVLACPRLGMATIEETMEAAKYIRDEGAADVLAITTDTYSRRMQLDKAKNALQQSQQLGRSLLNGFPAILHGVEGTRQVYEASDLPISTRHGAPPNQLHNLVAVSAGATDVNGGALIFGLCVEALTPLEQTILNMQFTDRLIGWFEEKGVTISKESSGCVGSIIPPSIKVATAVIEALLAAEQGVKNFGVAYCVTTCIAQDIAAMQVERRLCEAYLKRFGYEANVVQTMFQWMGPFPQDQARAFSRICLDAAIAKWGGASRIMTKSPEEGFGLPSKEAQAAAIRNIKETLSLLRNQDFPESQDLKLERDFIEAEARAMIDKAFELGEGDIAVGAVRALKAGALDMPYSAHKDNPGKALAVRDSKGAVRWLGFGNLPFNKEIKEFHQQRVAERRNAENKKDYQLVIDDLTHELKPLGST